MKKTKNHIIWLHVLAALLVAVSHAFIYTNNKYGGSIREYKALADFIYLFHVPLFMCISGYLFQYSEVVCRNCSTPFPVFFRKKVFRLMIPFFIILFLYVKPIKYFTKVYTSINLDFLLATHNLWYLYVLFIISIGAKLLINWVRKSKTNACVICAAGIVLNIVSAYLDGPIHHVLFYIYYFILGAWLCQKEDQKGAVWKAAAGYCGIWGIAYLIGHQLNGVPLWLEAVGKLGAGSALVLFIFAVFILLKDRKVPGAVAFLSGYSMGIYLFHEPLMNVYAYVLNADSVGHWLYFAGMLCASIAVSMGITFVLRKMKLGIVLGE